MRIYKAFVICLGILVSGCASLEDFAAEQEAKPACCDSFAGFKYEPLVQDTPAKMTLGKDSPTFNFSTGKSYYKAYTLPQKLRDGVLRVRSYTTGAASIDSKKLSQVYCSQVTFVDANYSMVSTDRILPSKATGYLASGFGLSFVSEYVIPPSASYVVLHSHPAGYGRYVHWYTSGGVFVVGKTLVMDPGGGLVEHPCGPIADAEVSVQ
jgi:hypothetical protein